jgi:predicted DNA-binding transcriptional regulator AlpA
MKAKPTVQRDDVPRELWTAEQVANFLGVPVATLYRWRHFGTGPHAYRVGPSALRPGEAASVA